jgi:hypothetical protein
MQFLSNVHAVITGGVLVILGGSIRRNVEWRASRLCAW